MAGVHLATSRLSYTNASIRLNFDIMVAKMVRNHTVCTNIKNKTSEHYFKFIPMQNAVYVSFDYFLTFCA
jgi:hypothetical protein